MFQIGESLQNIIQSDCFCDLGNVKEVIYNGSCVVGVVPI